MKSSEHQAASFVEIELRGADPVAAERAVAEAYAAGAVGLEERADADGIILVLYAPTARAERVREAVAAQGVAVAAASALPEVNWSERWKQDAKVVLVSPRLMIRPSFDRTAGAPGQCVLEIDPAQAFGTGSHESTRLALDCIDTIAGELSPAQSLLDVGTGTGVLALAALSLGCGRAIGLDHDPLAGAEARRNALRNGFADRLHVFVGELAALAPGVGFEWVVANLLLSELWPLLGAIAAQMRPGGHAIFSGLLEEQAAVVGAEAAGHGLTLRAMRRRVDASGVGWASLIMRRASAPASPQAGDPA